MIEDKRKYKNYILWEILHTENKEFLNIDRSKLRFKNSIIILLKHEDKNLY